MGASWLAEKPLAANGRQYARTIEEVCTNVFFNRFIEK